VLTKFKYPRIAAVAFFVTAAILLIVNVVPDKPLLVAERLFPGWGGWIQILAISVYSGVLSTKMMDRKTRRGWRLFAWTLFCFVFYFQLVLGMAVDSVFLLTGKLHLPIPSMIVVAPFYRFSSLFMIILFISTVLLTGPAWCSQLCYFGSMDALASSVASKKKRFGFLKGNWYKHRNIIKLAALLLMVGIAIVLRVAGIGSGVATLLGLFAGVLGLLLVVLVSAKTGIMTNCTLYCPIGTVVNNIKKISPFRFVINDNCTNCKACIVKCNYMALTEQTIISKEPGKTCTYCGDCMSACKHNAFEYRFFKIDPKNAERLWIVMTVIMHSVFLAVARI